MRARALLGAFLALSVAACDAVVPQNPVLRPQGAPARPANTPQEPAPRSAASLELEAYYDRVQRSLLSQGLLRQGGGGPDTPFDARILTRNFLRIAFFREFSSRNGRIEERQTPGVLVRWDRPVRMNLQFGDSVAPGSIIQDRESVARYTARLARLTGLDLRLVPANGNFTVLVLNEDERRALGPRLRELIPGISAGDVGALINLERSSYCVVVASDSQDNGRYTRAVAIIRAETPDLLRLSCLHEEIAQGLGLSNDSPAARPSIFNDDEEFALLTTHDEFLLRMLYDPRLRPGMTIDEAAPIAREIAEDLLGGES